MKRFLTNSIVVFILAAFSFGSCFGGQRRRRVQQQDLHVQQQDSSVYNPIRQDIFAVYDMLKSVSRRSISDSNLRFLLDDIKQDMFEAYIAAKGGKSSYGNYGAYSKRELNKYIIPFDDEYVKVYAQIVDNRLERMLERKDLDLDRAINLVLTRYVAVQAGARNLPMVQQAIFDELKKQGIQVRHGWKARSKAYPRAYPYDGYDEYGYKEESSLTKIMKYALGVGAIAGVATAGAYGVYHFGVDKENKPAKGFWNWLFPKEGTGFFSLDKKTQEPTTTPIAD